MKLHLLQLQKNTTFKVSHIQDLFTKFKEFSEGENSK